MPLRMSPSGERLSRRGGIVELMEDLGEAVSGAGAGRVRMLGGGAPAAIPEVQAVWRRRVAELAAEPQRLDAVLGAYDGPAGNPAFRASVAEFFRTTYGWPVTAENVAVTPGGQAAFFELFTLLAGDGRRVLLPITPEYIGYADQGLTPDLFRAQRPSIESVGDHEFKYHVDFDALEIGDDVGAVCVSRPTNPSGNVLGDDEVNRLAAMAREAGVPLVIDNAYGLPFPGAVFTDARPPAWDPGVVMVYSLSKLGLPGTRTGIVIAQEEIVRRLAAMTAVIGLANTNIGQAIVRPMLDSGELLSLSREVIRPFYEQRSQFARAVIAEEFRDDFPYRVHLSEGAFFLWLWLPELPIRSRELYERLKRRDVLVVPGEYFFFGLDEARDWPHRTQCLRLTFSQSEQTVREGIAGIAEELRELHG